MQFQFDGVTFSTEHELVQAIYRSNVSTLSGLTTADAAAEIISAMGMNPKAKGWMADQKMDTVTRAIDAARDSAVSHRALGLAKDHLAAVKAGFKGDKSDYVSGYVRATKQFVDYLEMLNKGATVEAAEEAVS